MKFKGVLSNQRGFTLIELLVVLMVLGILAAIAIPRFGNMQNKAQEVKARTELKQVQTAMELYYAEHNAYPASDEDFDNVLTNSLDEYITTTDLSDYDFGEYVNEGSNYSITVDSPISLTITRVSIE